MYIVYDYRTYTVAVGGCADNVVALCAWRAVYKPEILKTKTLHTKIK